VLSDVEALADAALVAIAVDDEVLGTGFVVDGDGTVLTCHHVVAGRTTVRLHCPDGSITDVSEADILAMPEIDLALIRAAAPFGTPLPLVSDPFATTRYWAKGYHRLSGAIRAAFPVQGNIIGRTSISYEGLTFEYQIGNVFVLRDDSIEPGLSGAPVLDLDAGAVVAVVSTKFSSESWHGGFAVPIGHAADNPLLRPVVEQNQSAVPAFGPYLNAPAARALCAEVTESGLDSLAQLRNVDLHRRVPRRAIEAAMAAFIDSDSPILALVGRSGVGKSTEMAALARRLPGRALLLRGSSLSRESADGGLGEAIRAAVNRARGKRWLPDDVDERMARVLAPDGGLVVLLDALNEAPFSGRGFEEWVGNTRSWLRGTTGRLVVSCRSELWGDLAGRALSVPLGNRTPTVASLAGFDDDEYLAALDVYGNVTGSDSPVLRLPLVLGLLSRYQADTHRSLEGNISLNAAIEAYIEDAARSLAARGSGAPLSVHVMWSRLVAIAELMWKQDRDTVDITSLGNIFGGATSTIDDLVSEGVMATTPSGLRFVYDDVSDWLQARTVDLNRDLAAIISHDSSSWRRVGPIAAALRDVESSQGPDALRDLLVVLVEGSGTTESPAFRVVEDTLVKISDALPYRQVLDRMVELTVSPQAQSYLDEVYGFADPAHIDFWRSVPLPLPERLDLLRNLCPLNDYYHWRPKDWAANANWPTPGFVSHSYSALALYLVSQDPPTGIPALVSWLEDRTPLVGDEATVAHIAMGILYSLRFTREGPVRQVMIDAAHLCQDLFIRLAMDDPQFLARMIIAEPDTKATDPQMIYAARLILGRNVLPGELSQDAYAAIARRYERGVGKGRQGPFLNVLIGGPDGPSYLTPVVDAYQNGVPEVDEWTLASAARYDHNGIAISILVSALNSGGERRETTLGALGNARDPDVRAFSDHAVLRHIEQTGHIDLHVCRYAEDRLWLGHVASEDLLAIIMAIIHAPANSDRDILMYPLTNSNGLRDPAQSFALMREFIEASDGWDSIKVIVRQLAFTATNPESHFDLPEILDLLKLALARLDPAAADRALFGQAYSSGPFAHILAGWLASGELAPPGENVSRFLALAQAGEDPASAARQIWQALGRKHGTNEHGSN
jgi:hypothetical protein